MNTKIVIGSALGGLALVVVLAAALDQYGDDEESASLFDQGASQQGNMQAGNTPAGVPQQDGAQQALQGLLQIRQEQCQTGNQLACQSLNEFPGHSQRLAQWLQACRSGDGQACGSYKNLAENIFTAYSESAAVMRQGAEAMAQMNAWRSQMNANAAASMANLRAQAAAGQAAHEARQESYAAMNNAWQSGQDGGDIAQQQRIDQIYEQERCADGRVVSIHVGC